MNLPVVRNLQFQDLQEITRVHLAAFPKSALGQLGAEAVTNYYKWQLESQPDAEALGVDCETNLAGFCFAGIFREALSGFLRKNKRFLIRQVLTRPWLIMTPFFRERLNLALKILMSRSISNLTPTQHPQKTFGILSIAVDPKVQGEGYGKLLLTAAEKIARERCFDRMQLTVVVDNDRAITFYEKSGWQKTLGPDAVWRGSMMKHLEGVNE